MSYYRRVLQDQLVINKAGVTMTASTISFLGNTILDSGSGFVSAGFEVGQTVTISGTLHNNVTVVLTAVAAGTLTASATAFTTETAGSSFTIATSRNGFVLNVTDFRDVVLSFASDKSANLTVKVQGAIGVIGTDTTASQGEIIAPDFTSAASATNTWSYIQSVDLNTGVPINGSTGIVYTGSDSVSLVEVNTNALDFLTVVVTAESAGNITVKAVSATNA